MIKKILAMAVAAALSSPALAQSINIDFNSTFGTPAATFGAAAAMPGTWNQLGVGGGGGLVNIAGGATGASCIVGGAGGPGALFSTDNPLTSGDTQALLDDGLDLGGVGALHTITISGLTAGSYNFYIYAWAPDVATFSTGVALGAGPVQTVGGTFAGFAQGVTHALFSGVAVAGGSSVVFNTTTVSGFSTLDGVQIQLVPGPAGLALLGIGGLVRRRRRG